MTERSRTMDYMGILKEAWEVTRRNKRLWILGLFAGGVTVPDVRTLTLAEATTTRPLVWTARLVTAALRLAWPRM